MCTFLSGSQGTWRFQCLECIQCTQWTQLLYTIVIIHSTKSSAIITILYNICSCLFNNLTHCTVQIKGLKIQWTEIQSNQAFYNFLQ